MTKDKFYKLLDKAIKPSSSKDEKDEQETSSQNSGKQTRQRKSEDTSLKQNDKSRPKTS